MNQTGKIRHHSKSYRFWAVDPDASTGNLGSSTLPVTNHEGPLRTLGRPRLQHDILLAGAYTDTAFVWIPTIRPKGNPASDGSPRR